MNELDRLSKKIQISPKETVFYCQKIKQCC